jgi:hypothetical protein
MERFLVQDRVSYPLCLSLGALALAIDYLTGPLIHFPILYLLPILLASWGPGIVPGLIFALAMPLVRLGFDFFWEVPWGWREAAVNALIQGSVFALVAYLVHVVATQHRALRREVRVLEGLLPICSFCKKIRNEEGEWEVLESYITDKSEAKFSHGLCPVCLKEQYGEILGD